MSAVLRPPPQLLLHCLKPATSEIIAETGLHSSLAPSKQGLGQAHRRASVWALWSAGFVSFATIRVSMLAARKPRLVAGRLAIGCHYSNCVAARELEFASFELQGCSTDWWSSTIPVPAF